VKAGRDRPAHRAVSGWLLALSSTGLAITAHGLAGGAMPDSVLIIPVTALMAWGGAAMASALRRPAVLTATVGVLQLVLHLLLSQSHAHHTAAVHGGAMLATHVIASVLVALLLARATDGLTLGWLRARLRVLWLIPAPVRASGGVSVVPVRPGQLLETVLRRVLARRGPPVHS
jgi:hypothetical protein